MRLGGQGGEAEEHHAEADAHHDEGLPGVLPGRLLERGHAVRDRLDTGDGGATGRERVEHSEDPRAVEQPFLEADLLRRLGQEPHERQGAADVLPQAEAEEEGHVDDEEVGRDREDPSRLLHPPQVAEGHDAR